MELTVIPPGEALPAGWPTAVRALFRTAYHRYHYLEPLTAADRCRFVVHVGARPLGYATLREVRGHALLAHLLVHPEARGRGLGHLLETARLARARAAGLRCYTSCSCETGISQRMKAAAGLRPVAVKYGYRQGVSRPGSRGSAVVYSDAETVAPGVPAGPDALDEDPARGRLRWRGADPATVPDRLLTCPDSYAELLTGAVGARRLHHDPRVAYAGRDLDSGTGQWLHSFQVRNTAYREGLAERPVVVAAPPGVRLPQRLPLSEEVAVC